MNSLVIKGILVLGLMYMAFVLKFGWETGSIVMGALLIGLAITSGAIGLLKK